jgi:putative hydrolase of the HAD superfamily
MSPSPVLRGILEDHGVLDRFDHWSFSDEVGVYKPHPEIFEHALAGLGGVAPERAAHVGDLHRTDVAGAKAMGITAIRYKGSNDDVGDVGDMGELIHADHVIDDHAEIPALLGLA